MCQRIRGWKRWLVAAACGVFVSATLVLANAAPVLAATLHGGAHAGPACWCIRARSCRSMGWISSPWGWRRHWRASPSPSTVVMPHVKRLPSGISGARPRHPTRRRAGGGRSSGPPPARGSRVFRKLQNAIQYVRGHWLGPIPLLSA